jgi:hypothetical protein
MLRGAISIMLLLLAGYVAQGQEITLYVIPPPVPMNWHSPQALLVSYIKNLTARSKYFKRRHPMGHVVVELRDSAHMVVAGIVAESKADLAYRVYAKGYGLGILFTPLPGKMEEGDINTRELSERLKKGDVAFIRFRINDAAFNRLWQYIHEYKERGYDRIYNGANKPREGKGAGCSSFGLSFIEIAGLLPQEETDKWKVSVNIPEKLIGGPERANKWVGLHKIIFKSKWADTTRQPYRKIAYYEPYFMYEWIAAAWVDSNLSTKKRYVKEKKGSAKGLLIDCSECTLPGEEVWLQGSRK